MKQLLLLFFCAFTLTASAQNHWESIILAENEWSYFEGNSEPDAAWNSASFDDANWKQGLGGLGYNDGDDATVVTAVSSLYLRKTFQVSDPSIIEQLFLDIDYDDGFVTYINGQELARSSNITSGAPAFDSGTSTDREAQVYNGGVYERYKLDKSPLVAGDNVLAVHILNTNTSSSDLSALVNLHAQIAGSTRVYQNTPSWFVEPINYTSSNLPIVKITTNNQSIQDDPKITAHMGIINNGHGNINHLTDTFTDYDGYIGVETRGQSSQYFFPKKSYGLETRDEFGENLNVNLLGMPKENDWILYAPYSDKSMLRNVITFELAKSLGTYSSRTAFCELYVNDNYEGIYVLMEKIKRDDSRVNIDSLISISGDDNSLSGGYIFKVDKIDPDYVNLYTGWTTYPTPSYPNAMDITYQYLYPKPKNIKISERNYLKNFVTEAEEVLISSEFDNKETGYNSYLNMGSFIDFMLINEVSKEVDKYRYSNYFYKKKSSKGGEIFAGPIWDFNLGYGNVNYWYDGTLTSGWLYSDVKNLDNSIIFWWKRLMEDAYFESEAKRRYQALRNDEWNDANVTYLIDSITDYLAQAQIRNYKRWPILGTEVWPNYVWANMTYADETEQFKTWILGRLSWMDNNILGAILSPSVSASLSKQQANDEYINVEIDLEDQFFNHKYLKAKHFAVKNTKQEFFIDRVVYNSPSSATLVLGNTIEIDYSDDISIKVKDNILTGFEDLQSNLINLPAAIEGSFAALPVKLFAFQQQIILEVAYPALLGESLSVYNIQGQLVRNYHLTSQRRNEIITALNGGVYIISVTYNGKIYTEKLML
ncbi:MAG: CotH kinase family protein [Bacteroidales bacterium]|jgi:hypothetical protein|nr:CotH kinase family protein [Bacteroidales bacterium]